MKRALWITWVLVCWMPQISNDKLYISPGCVFTPQKGTTISRFFPQDIFGRWSRQKTSPVEAGVPCIYSGPTRMLYSAFRWYTPQIHMFNPNMKLRFRWFENVETFAEWIMQVDMSGKFADNIKRTHVGFAWPRCFKKNKNIFSPMMVWCWFTMIESKKSPFSPHKLIDGGHSPNIRGLYTL